MIIRRAIDSDIRRVARTASLAFSADPVMRWLIPDDDDDYEANHQAFFGNVVRRWMATDSLWCTDDAVAIAGWVPPGRPEIEPDGLVLVEHPGWRIAVQSEHVTELASGESVILYLRRESVGPAL